jgi:hypothetical protein
MTSFTRLSAFIAGTTLLALAACSTATPAKDPKTNMQAKHQMMGGEHSDMMAQMKMDHAMMSKMDMSTMDMSKLSPECQTMMTKMKSKMAGKHKDGGMHAQHKSGMEGHDMSKMGDHDMMKDHDPEKMQTMMAKHKKCMAEMKEAMPHGH